MKARAGVIVMAVLLLLYMVLVGQRAIMLMQSGNTVGIIMGIALMILPIVGVWALTREILFGVRAERLGRILGEEGALPDEELPVLPSGRPVRDAADEIFPRYRSAVEAAPESWRAWYRLGLAYDGSGDRKRARGAIRTAIGLSRQDPAVRR